MPAFPGWNAWTFRAEKAKVEIVLYMAVSKKHVPSSPLSRKMLKQYDYISCPSTVIAQRLLYNIIAIYLQKDSHNDRLQRNPAALRPWILKAIYCGFLRLFRGHRKICTGCSTDLRNYVIRSQDTQL